MRDGESVGKLDLLCLKVFSRILQIGLIFVEGGWFSVIYRFGDHVFDTEGFRLTGRAGEIAVEPQVFALLQFLIENRERVVSKDEIIEAVWDGRIVSDGTLNSRINSARRALGDDGKAQAVIKTFPRRGFRFVAELSGDDETAPTPAPESASASDKPSIAVLPFHNLSGDPEQEYFSDGIAEDFITALSHIRSFFVIARNSSFSYKGQSPDIRTVVQELGVRYVLDGSVRKTSNRVRITVQLIDGGTGNNIWAEHFDRELSDIFAVQDEITRTVIGAIQPELQEAEWHRAKAKPPEHLDAWDFYLRGMSLVWDVAERGQLGSLEEAKNNFTKAIEFDPKFANAYAGLAICGFYLLILGHANNKAELENWSLNMGKKAVELAKDNFETHRALAMAYIAVNDPAQAVHHLNSAIEINPNSGSLHQQLGTAFVAMGQPEEGIRHLELALHLSPGESGAGPVHVRLAEARFMLGEYEKSVELAEEALRRPETQFWGNAILTCSLVKLGRIDDAKEAAAELLRRQPDLTISKVRESTFLASSGYLEPYLDSLRQAGVPEG